MKRLFLLRHAKSSWDDPDLADHDRPLAPPVPPPGHETASFR
jgi:phosphohistidine phosphatase SixA